MYRPLENDGEPDIVEYNEELEKRGNPSWMDVAWLFSECYLCEFFTTTKFMDKVRMAGG